MQAAWKYPAWALQAFKSSHYGKLLDIHKSTPLDQLPLEYSRHPLYSYLCKSITQYFLHFPQTNFSEVI